MLARRKRTLWLSLGLCLIAGLAIQFWLSTGPARRAILSAISQYYDGFVEVDRVTLRLAGGVVVKGLRFHESSDPQSIVVCEIPRLEMLGSLWDLTQGSFQPTSIWICKPRIRTSYAEDGSPQLNLHFRIPADLQQTCQIPIHITDASVEFTLPDDPGVTKRVGGIRLDLASDDSNNLIRFSGEIRDPLWQAWGLSGSWDIKSETLRASMRCESLKVDERILKWMGPRGSNLWSSCAPSGAIDVDVDVTWTKAASQPLTYHVLLDPQNVSAKIPTMPEQVRDLAGRVEISNHEIRVHGVAGRLAAGEIIASGVISRQASQNFNLAVELRRLAINQLAGNLLRGLPGPRDSLTGRLQLRGTPDPKSWSGSFEGTISLPDQFDHQVPVHLSVAGGYLECTDLQLDWAGGHLVANGRMPVESGREAEGTVSLDHFDLRALSELAVPGEFSVRGTVDAQLEFRVPSELWSDPYAWEWVGQVRLQQPLFDTVQFETLAGTMSCRDRSLRLENGRAMLEGQEFEGRLGLSLVEPFEISAGFRMKPLEFGYRQTVQSPASPTASGGRLSANGTLAGRLSPPDIKVRGTGSVEELRVAGYEFEPVEFCFELVDDAFRMDGAELRACGGVVRLGGRWDWNTPPEATPEGGNLRLVGSFQGLDIASLLETTGSDAIGLKGQARGQVEIKAAVRSEGSFDIQRASGYVATGRLAIGGLAANRAAAEFVFDREMLEFKNLSVDLPAGHIEGFSRLRVSGGATDWVAELSSPAIALAALGLRSDSRAPTLNVAGEASGNMSLRWNPDAGGLVGQGTLRAKSLVLGELTPIDFVECREVQLRDRRLMLRNFQARLWNGQAAGTAILDWNESAENLLQVSLGRVERLELGRMLRSGLVLNDRPHGKLSGTGRLSVPTRNLGIVLGTGEFTFENGRIAGLPVSRAVGTWQAYDSSTHQVLSGVVQPRAPGRPTAPGDQRILFSFSNAQVAHGEAYGEIVLGLSKLTTYQTHLHFEGLDLATLVQTISVQYPISGKLSGEMRIRGSSRGMADSVGELSLRVDHANLWRTPVMAAIVKEFSRILNRLLSPNFQEAGQTAAARQVVLERGVFRTNDLWFASDVTQLHGQGTVTVDGRIDMDVVGNLETGLPRDMPFIGQLNKALNFIQQRLVKIHLTGTLTDPVAVPVPLQDLTEPAERFFRGILTGTLFDSAEPNPRAPRR